MLVSLYLVIFVISKTICLFDEYTYILIDSLKLLHSLSPSDCQSTILLISIEISTYSLYLQ